MSRVAARVVPAVVVLAVLLACSGARTSVPPATTPSPTAPPRRTPAPAASPAAGLLPTLDPSGRLPAVLAQLSLGLPEGDAYAPQAAAFDDAGRAVVLCASHGPSQTLPSALVVVDPARASRGPVIPLPGRAFAGLAAYGGRAYLGYEDAAFMHHLAAVDLATGRVLADVPVEPYGSAGSLAVDPGGHLYSLQNDRVELRDAVTLEMRGTLADSGGPGPGTLACDPARSRLYVARGPHLQAYRTADLALVWQASVPHGDVRRLVLDGAGAQVYAQAEGYEGDNPVARLYAFDATGGRLQGPLPSPEGTTWQLVAADSTSDRLLFAAPSPANTRLWQAHLDGQLTGATVTVGGYAQVYAAGRQYMLALATDRHLVRIYDQAGLQPLGEVVMGIEIRHLVVDAARGRAYLNDAAGRLHLLDTRSNRLQATIAAGSGLLTLDAPNDLLFVGREPGGHEVAVVDTAALTVTGVITGGYQVAVDSAGRRAFVGYAAPSVVDTDPGEVQVWDTRTFRRLGAIAHRGEPAYNPLRDEVYLRDYSAYVVDGQTLRLVGELTPDVSAQPIRGCNGCLIVAGIHVEPEHDVLAVVVQTLATGGGPGTIRQPLLFSARTREPLTHTVTVLTPSGGGDPLIVGPDEDRVYTTARYARYVTFDSTLVYQVGSSEPLAYREGLSIDYFLPGKRVALSRRPSHILAFDPHPLHWEPLGWIPYQPIRHVDLAARRLYAWERALLTVLSFDGAQPAAPQMPEPWPAGKALGEILDIQPSPAFARDRTLFVVAAGGLLRSTDGGTNWRLLRGGLPPSTAWAPPRYTLAVSPGFEQDRTLFAGGASGESMGLGVWRSVDGGDTWQPAWHGLAHLRVNRLAISPRYAEDSMVLAYAPYSLFWRGESGQSLFRSENGGAAWTLLAQADAARAETLPEPQELLPYPEEPVRFRVGDYGQAVLRSGDGGRTWQAVLHLGPGHPALVARSPALARDGQVYVLDPFCLYRSGDSGLIWEVTTDPRAMRPAGTFTALAVALGGDGRPVVFLGDRLGSLLALDPGELTWAPVAPPAPIPAPPPSPTPCPAAVPRLAPWGQHLLGCPEAAPQELYMAWQPFERGMMFWLSDRREILVLHSDLGINRWLAFPDTWQEGQPDRDPALQPPPDREQPIRGFGRVWREELGGPQAEIGWAVRGEQGYTGRRQPYAGGQILTAPDGRIYALFADGAWLSQ